MNKRNRYVTISALIGILHGPLDGFTSFYGMLTYGSDIEANPLMRSLFEFNALAFLSLKLIAGFLITVLLISIIVESEFWKWPKYSTKHKISYYYVLIMYAVILSMGLFAVIGNSYVLFTKF